MSHSPPTISSAETGTLPPRKSTLALLAVVGVSTIATALFFYRVVFTDQIFIARDILRVYYPLHKFWVDQVRSGRFPDWYPYDALGQPYVGMVISGAFHPTNLLYLFGSLGSALKLNVLLCYPCAFTGTYMLGKRWGLDVTSALLTAVLFTFNGYMVGITNNLLYLMAAATFPWAFWASDRYLERPGVLRASVAALLLALILLAGDAQSFAVASACLIPLFLCRTRTSRLRALVQLTGIYVLAALFALPQLVGALQVLKAGRPGQNPLHVALEWSLDPRLLYDLLLGPVFAEPATNSVTYQALAKVLAAQVFSSLWVDGLYIGLVGVALAMAALLRHRRLGRAWVLAGLGLGVLWLALGRFGGLYAFVFRWIPLWRPFRYPEKLIPYFLFVLAIGAGFGFKAANQEKKFRKSIAVLLFVLAGLTLLFTVSPLQPMFVHSLLTGSGSALFSDVTKQAAFHAALVAGAIAIVFLAPLRSGLMSGLVLCVVFVDLFSANQRIYQSAIPEILTFEPGTLDEALKDPSAGLGRGRVVSAADWGVFPKEPGLGLGEVLASALLTGMVADTPALHGLESMEWYLPAGSAEWMDLLADHTSWVGNHTDVFSARYVIVSPGAVINPRQDPVTLSKSFGCSLLKNLEPLPRAALRRPRCVAGHGAAIDALVSPAFDWNKDAIVECPPGGLLSEEIGAPRPLGSAEITRYRTDEVDIAVHATASALLLLNDAYYPGWKATVDQHPAEILRVNGVVRGVMVSPGTHSVQFTYRTPGLRAGCLIALFALLLAVTGGAAQEYWRSRRLALSSPG